MIYANHQSLGTYQRYLRQGHKQRQRRKGIKAKRGVQTVWALNIAQPSPI